MDVGNFKKSAGARLKQFIETTDYNKSEFAKMLGIRPPTLLKVLSKGGGMSADLVCGISKRYPNLNWNWIFNGVGNMIITDNSNTENGDVENIDSDNFRDILKEKDKTIAEKNRLISERDSLIAAKDRVAEQRDKLIEELQVILERAQKDKEQLYQDKERLWELLEQKKG